MADTDTHTPHLSLVIPARNEEAYLPTLLDSVDAARARFDAGADAVEVIVADNASTDATAEVARARGCRVVREEKRVIAAVRNAGARAARAGIIAFIDADSVIHPETFNAIDAAMSGGRIAAGATGLKPDRWSPAVAVQWAMFLPMAWITGIDGGVIFCRREDFQEVGGYNENRLFAEDVEFVLAVRRLVRSRGHRTIRLRRCKATTSMRKFDVFGEWHMLTAMCRGAYWALFSRGSIEAFAKEYWYSDRARPGHPPSE